MADEIRVGDAAVFSSAIAAARRGTDSADALISAAATKAGCDAVVTFDRRAAGRPGWRIA